MGTFDRFSGWASIIGTSLGLFVFVTGAPSLPHLLGLSSAPARTPILVDGNLSVASRVFALFLAQVVSWILYYKLLSAVHARLFKAAEFQFFLHSAVTPGAPRGAGIATMLAIAFGLGWSLVFAILWWGSLPESGTGAFFGLIAFGVWSAYLSVGVVWSAFRCGV